MSVLRGLQRLKPVLSSHGNTSKAVDILYYVFECLLEFIMFQINYIHLF